MSRRALLLLSIASTATAVSALVDDLAVTNGTVRIGADAVFAVAFVAVLVTYFGLRRI
jgi:hypothetical protein